MLNQIVVVILYGIMVRFLYGRLFGALLLEQRRSDGGRREQIAYRSVTVENPPEAFSSALDRGGGGVYS